MPLRLAGAFVYGVAVQAFASVCVSRRLDAAGRRRLRDAGFDLDAPVEAVYPAMVFHRFVELAAATAYPELPPHDAQYQAGRDHVDAFASTPSGRRMRDIARQSDPRTVLEYAATFMRLGNNFTESRARALCDGRMELWLNDVGGVPDWYRGLIARGLEHANASGVEVRQVPGGSGATYVVSWSAA